MKPDFSSSRGSRNQSSSESHHHQTSNSHQLRQASSNSLPRPFRSSTLSASFRAVFQPHRVSSSASLRSSQSASSSANASTHTASTRLSVHPYAAMVAAPLPVVSSHDASDDEDECPVCLEPLSFSFRLPGEKPHIVPECGHALHEVSSLVRSDQCWIWSGLSVSLVKCDQEL